MLGDENKRFVIQPHESRILLTTSCLTVFPIYMAYQRSLWLYVFTSTGTMVCSLIYWHNPIHGWRRNMDLIYAKYTFVVYLGSGIWYIPRGFPSLIFYLGALSIFQTYVLTYVYPIIWFRYHVLFHIISICVKMYVLYYVTETYSTSVKLKQY
jgi:hypothetical protein